MDSLQFQALFLDLSGVLYEGEALVPGAVDTVARYREQGTVLRFVTNTATRSRRQILEKLRAIGVPLKDSELFTAPMAAQSLIRRNGWRPHCLIHENLVPDFAGFESRDPNCVVLGDARDGLGYAALNHAFHLVKSGAPLIGIGYNRCFKLNGRLMLDAGAFIHALEWAAETRAIITGKPSPAFFAEVVTSVGLTAADCLMVGDDAEADVAAALHAGLQGCQVRTGKFTPGDEAKLPPDAHILDSLADL